MTTPDKHHVRRRSVFADRLTAFSEFASGDDAAFARRGRWRQFFLERIGPSFDNRTVLEIGCADGSSLASFAAKHPLTGFIGLDWKYRHIFLAAEKVAALSLPNVALLRARAQDIRRIFYDCEVDEVLIFQPEPCDRPAEVANQLLTRAFFDNVAHVLATDGTVAIKTDHAELFANVRAMFEPAGSLAIDFVSEDFWNDPAAIERVRTRCFANEKTLFEERFLRRKQPIRYSELRR